MTLFKPGEIVLVRSDQAAGYKSRAKYHLCVCGHRSRYLFINSKTWQGSFAISHNDFPALPNPESHIACNTLLHVSDEYMKKNGAKSIGFLTKAIIGSLIDHINDCDVMTDEEKELAIDGLSGAL